VVDLPKDCESDDGQATEEADSGQQPRACPRLAQRQIEPAELHRVYPPATQRADTEAPHCHATVALEVEIASLRQVGELLPGQFEATRQDREGRRARAPQQTLVRFGLT
jgi:hypothetical protein